MSRVVGLLMYFYIGASFGFGFMLMKNMCFFLFEYVAE